MAAVLRETNKICHNPAGILTHLIPRGNE